jgi:glucose-1-phosphate adenylyltransferase
MAGGKGTRLMPLTKNRSKPAVPFGGKYRIVDFVLSNLVNSGLQSIYVLTQFKAQSLLRHLRDAWQFGDIIREQFIIPVPAQMRKGERWYAGTADATYQNLHLIDLAKPDLVLVFGADHVYKMDVRQMIDYHQRQRSKGTVAALPIAVSEAHQYGTMEIDENWRIVRFHEKISDPPEIPGRPGWTLASMGNYVFDQQILSDALRRDAFDEQSDHDFGRNVLPRMVDDHPVFAYDFATNLVPGEAPENIGYWRDVGSIESYYEANMNLRAIHPSLNLYNPEWPLRTANLNEGPAKSTFNEEGKRGKLVDSLICEGSILAGGEVFNSVLGRRVFVNSGATVEDSIILDNVRIGEGAKLKRVIVDKNAQIPPGATIGYDPEADRRHHTVSDTGIVIVKGHTSTIPVGTI